MAALEEADKVSLVALARAGVAVPPAVKDGGMSAFTAEALWAVLSQSLRLMKLDEGSELPASLPANVAARHRAATALAKAIKAAGLTQGEVGFNQILYPSEKDVRRLVSWAVSSIPRGDDAATDAAPTDAQGAALLRALPAWLGAGGKGAPLLMSGSAADARARGAAGIAIAAKALEAHLAAGCVARGSGPERSTRARHTRDAVLSALVAGEAGANATVNASAALALTANSGATAAAPLPSWDSWLRLRCAGARAGAASGVYFPGTALDAVSSAFNRRAAFAIVVVKNSSLRPAPIVASVPSAFERVKSDAEIAAEREEALAALSARADVATAAGALAASQRSALAAVLPALRAQLSAEISRAAELDRSVKAHGAAAAALPRATEELARLGGELRSAIARLGALAQEWAAAREPLDADIRELEKEAAARAAERVALEAALGRARVEMGELASSAAAKDEAIARAKAETERASGGAGGSGADDPPMSRSLYSTLLTDIVRGIRKQKAEIAKIVGDVRRVQLELAAVSEGLKRVAGVATDTMEKAAIEKKDDPNRRSALRQLLSLQEAFSALVATASAVGAAENEARDLDNRAEQMAQRNDKGALEALSKDLAALRAENAALEMRLRA